MQISKNLEQFTDRPTLLLVSGKQNAKIYFGLDGKLTVIHEFKIPKPKYSDLEGHFETRSAGAVVRAGSVYEPTTELAFHDFVRELRRVLKPIARRLVPTGLQSVWLICPQHLSRQTEAVLPLELRDKISVRIFGHYHKAHPFTFLAKIKEYRPESIS